MRTTQLRIVSGSLRGRKVTCNVNPNLRPTPDRVREALFSILGNAVPGTPFVDVFAGTGVVGLEAISRGATSVLFVERDFRLVEELEQHLRQFGVEDRSRIARADVYRWVERWQPPEGPVCVFLSPPFGDLERRSDDLLAVVRQLQEKLPAGSVLVLQAEECPMLAEVPDRTRWDERTYGRNHLLFWVKESPPPQIEGTDAPPQDAS
jgi:16S rRNA (guanine966-N2)-methyltransferase